MGFFSELLRNIEERLAQYIPLQANGEATGLYVTQLTREHLRKTLSFFLSTNANQSPVPFQEAGTGTLNTLVLALLSFIAEAKPDSVVFAMEEPEIALPPHTQRRIANYLLKDTSQCFVSSHSPYIIERFDQSQINILRRDAEANLTLTGISGVQSLKPKHYKRHARRGVAEAMLGAGVIVAEGVTEHSALQAVAEKLESSNESIWPLDLCGVTIFSVDGDGDLSAFGAFFRAIGLKTFAFYDKKNRPAAQNAALSASFDIPRETAFERIEDLLVTETPPDRHWEMLSAIRNSGSQGNLMIPAHRPEQEALRKLTYSALKSNKGNGFAGQLIDLCSIEELPATIVNFLNEIYALFRKPNKPPVLAPVVKVAAADAVLPVQTPNAGGAV